MPQFRRLIQRWARCWKLPGFEKRLVIQSSHRMTVSLGRSYVSRHLVRLSDVLLLPENKDSLAEVLCHEAAHVAVFEKHGAKCRPHGVEWRKLVQDAGFKPQLTVAIATPVERKPTTSPASVFEHRCPVCQMVRLAARPVRRWRCATCRAMGLDGELVIRRTSRKKGQRNDD